MTLSPIAGSLLEWYAAHARALPWREVSDPYAVWVSEIMLQQTRVETVIPYYERWMVRFPTIQSLANAELQDVLNFWEGLGYYTRARYLHRAAKVVISEYRGELPKDVDTLRRLPGIGPYTAGAIASIAFGSDEPVVDGNVRRVFARLFHITKPVDSTEGQRRIWELVEANLPAGRASEYNQALMDLGATICVPRDPNCQSCPLNHLCQSYERGVQADLPVMKPKSRSPHFIVTAAVIRRNGQILITQRPEDGLLGGLWEFPGGKLEPGEDLVSCLEREIEEELGVRVKVGGSLGIYKHAYTHFRVTLHAFGCTLVDGEPQPLKVADLRWVSPEELPVYPMGKIDRQISQRVNGENPYD